MPYGTTSTHIGNMMNPRQTTIKSKPHNHTSASWSQLTQHHINIGGYGNPVEQYETLNHMTKG